MQCHHIRNDPDGVLFVGEAPGKGEMNEGIPLVGQSGHLLTRCLAAAGHLPKMFLKEYEESSKGLGHFCADKHPAVRHISLANVANVRPWDNKIENFFRNKTEGKKGNFKEHGGFYITDHINQGLNALEATIQATRPRIVVALGNVALWALTGNTGSATNAPSGIASWRGSQLVTHHGIPCLPTLHPAFILRMFNQRVVLQHDLAERFSRFWSEGCDEWWRTVRTHHIRPTYDEVHQWLDLLTSYAESGRTLTCDLETSHHTWITNIGFGVSSTESYTIPFTDSVGRYWSPEQETEIKWRLRSILSHPNATIVWQNGEYDRTYTLSELLVNAKLTRDTRTIHHTHYPSLPATLHFMSSLYCDDHVYWKDESGEAAEDGDDDRAWRYNGTDCCRTYEIDEKLQAQTEAMEMADQVDFEMDLHPRVYRTMQRGVRVSRRRVEKLQNWNAHEQLRLSSELEAMVGTHVESSPKSAAWHASPHQQRTLFYKWFELPVVRDKKTKRPTVNDEALPLFYHGEPLVRPIVKRLLSLRQLRTMMSNVLKRKQRGGRWVTQYTVPGTVTLRFASAMDGQDYGLNMQNLSSGAEAQEFELLDKPNVRKLIIPDPGNCINDIDLDRADLQIVVWEADDADLKEALRKGLDIHQVNADAIGCSRKDAKAGVHATNYYAQPPTLARVLGCSISEARNFQVKWFLAHPGIKRWHERTLNSIMVHNKVSNPFGFHCHFWGRPEQELPEALAWIPQSTVANVINKAWQQVEDSPITGPHIRVSIQVHDSIVLEWAKNKDQWLRPLVQETMLVDIPYDDPLQISVGIKTSLDSWGEVEEVPWSDPRPFPQRFRSPSEDAA